jgi:uncharacterized protein (TIGR02147 family)
VAELPNVFDHADHRTFLQTWFQAKKDVNPSFSHRAFARRLGSTNPSLLVNILSGRRRISPDQLEAFVRVVGLEGPAAEYFRLLVRFGQAEDADERHRAWAAITELRSRLQAPEIDSSRFLYLSDRLYPAVLELSRCVGFRADPAWIAARLTPPVPTERAAEALALLERLGFLVREGDRLVPAEPVVRTSANVARLGSFGYHRQTNELVGELLDRVWDPEAGIADETAFLGLTLAVPQERLADLRRLLWEAQLQIAHQCEAWDAPDRVVQVTIQMYPVSTRTTG